MTEGHILHFFAGKGGAGKSTLSMAFALTLADDHPKEKILLVSLGQSSSFSDLAKKKLNAVPAKLSNGNGKGTGGLFVAELGDVDAAEFSTLYDTAVRSFAIKGTYLNDADIRQILQGSGVGFEDLAALMKINGLLEDGSYDRVIIDSAPTSTCLRALALPDHLRRLLSFGDPAAADRAASKGKKPAPGAAEVDPKSLLARVEKLSALLHDPVRCAFHIVSLAEPVAEAQTRSLFAELRAGAFPIAEIVVNQVEEQGGCPACQGRRGLQAPHVRKYQGLDKNVPVQLLAKREQAARGTDALKKFGREWIGLKETKALEFSAAEGPPALVRAPSMPPIAAPPLPATRLIFFVGQGGVGKSSCAAAAAVTLTEKEGPVLLISIDPSHSLSDVLQCRLTDTESQVKGTKGLYARELDVDGWFSTFRRKLKERTDPLFETSAKGEAPADRELLRGLLEAAPPGMDQFAAMSVLTDALVQERFKRIVVDPVASDHTVSVLDVPPVAKAWLTSVLAVLSKYRAKGFGPVIDEVSGMVKHVERFEKALASPTESRFVVVTRGEDLAAPKTERLVETLKARKLAVERVLVNRVLPKSNCPKCENRRKNELLVAKNIEKKVGLPVTVAPALGRHPAGLRELKAFRTSWYALSAPAAKIKAA